MVMNIWSGFGKLEFHLHLLLLRRQWILLKCRLTVVLICNNINNIETKQVLQVGSGEEAVSGCECTMSYKGTLKEDGSTFDQAKKFKFCLGAGEVIKGWEVRICGKIVTPNSGKSIAGWGQRDESRWREKADRAF